jgi:hypothetical protein
MSAPTTDELADMPVPPGAVSTRSWDNPDNTGLPQPNRYFSGTSRVVEIGTQQPPLGDGRPRTVEVEITGVQWADGTVERAITVDELHHEDALTLVEALDIAHALTAAVVEAKWGAQPDHPGIPTGTQPIMRFTVSPEAAGDFADQIGSREPDSPV